MARTSLAAQNKELTRKVQELELRLSCRDKMPEALIDLASGIEPQDKVMVDAYYDRKAPSFSNGSASALVAGHPPDECSKTWYRRSKRPEVAAYTSLRQAEMLAALSNAAPAAMGLLQDIALGLEKETVVTKDGGTVEVPADLATRAKAAKAILAETRQSRGFLEKLISSIIEGAIHGKLRLSDEDRAALMRMEDPTDIVALVEGKVL